MRRLLAIPLLVGLSLSAAVGAAEYKAPQRIIATLPQYCWAQYVDGLENNPAYQIRGCHYSNHFCPGLVEIARARTESQNWKKKELLLSARKNMEYTLRFNKAQMPSCFLIPEAEKNIALLNIKLKAFR